MSCEVGSRYGRWTVLEHGPTDATCVARCDCGRVLRRHIANMRSGKSRSCGCLRNEDRRNPNSPKRTHPAEYVAWMRMRGRCRNPSDTSYHRYGARGIEVCERWDSFESFLKDMGKRPSSRHSLDRIDNDGDYCPENCRWASRKEQANNTRRNRILTIFGVSKTMAEWSEDGRCRCSYWNICRRLASGWDAERAVTTPTRRMSPCRRVS